VCDDLPSFCQTTGEELSHHALDHGAQGPVGAGEPLGPDAEKLLEMLLDESEER
jgi:hypothetical protein